ncbi:MAG TPA: B12-binding domain-containing radical SAM protein [Candidatus Brocadiaceae bacterium]|nr:MAG: hypothetical protein A2Y09_06685 [Planctomycetes bacterium GWA2_39_15]
MSSLYKTNVDLLLIIPPSRIKHTIYPPYGAMYIASALRQKGYTPMILNVDTERINNQGVIERVRQINPKYIGFSGIVAPSYKYIKDLSREIKQAFPNKIQILGGGLTSAVEPVLQHTAINIVVHGEGEIAIVELMDCLKSNKDLNSISGITFKNEFSNVHTDKRETIKDLDSLPYPAFDLIDISEYLPDGIEFIRKFTTKIDKRIYNSKRKRKMITIPTSRGCFGICSFCFRANRGIRVHSMKYVFDFIEYCIEKFDVGFFTFGDECFAPNKKRNWDFIEEYKRRNLDIIFRILGMRVDTVDKDILKAYKEIGCWMIEYGFESGNQKMLNIIDKRVTVEQNRQVAILTKEAAIYTSPALVLGMPGETNKTIRESIDFLKSLNFNFKQYQMTYALPIPGSPLYDFSRLTGIVKDEDEYLSSLDGDTGRAGNFHVNLTDESDEVVAKWVTTIRDEMDEYYLYRKYKIKLLIKIMLPLQKIYINYKKKHLWVILKNKIKNLFNSRLKNVKKGDIQGIYPRFKKPVNINIEELLDGLDYSKINIEMSLKKINEKLLLKIGS